ncbi:HNH endonuclease [Roseomonas gilardii]|uniref:HNH endonuclease n=1 Tax=Roseomonas gilardii TaxID=257708 RepID=UPI0038D0BAB7
MTRLRLIIGGGKAEAQAAHIMPVAAGGLDVVPNGIPLSATVPWLFDRRLISLTDELELLVSHNRLALSCGACSSSRWIRSTCRRNAVSGLTPNTSDGTGSGSRRASPSARQTFLHLDCPWR